jgi:hypothetical protein
LRSIYFIEKDLRKIHHLASILREEIIASNSVVPAMKTAASRNSASKIGHDFFIIHFFQSINHSHLTLHSHCVQRRKLSKNK